MNEFDFLYDHMEQAISIRIKQEHNNYIKALLQVVKDLTISLDDTKVDPEDLTNLEMIYQTLQSRAYHTNTLKSVFQLLLIKGFKHQKKSLDVFVPNTIGYMIGHFLQVYFENKKDIRLLDVNLKSANFVLDVLSILDREDLDVVGLENDKEYVEIAKAFADFTLADILIYFQDPLQEFHESFDAIIGELQAEEYENYKYYSPLYQAGVRYLPFLLIEKYANKLHDNGLMVCIVDQDFFFHIDFKKMKEEVKGLAWPGFVVLPESMFQAGVKPKGILLLQKTTKSYPQMQLIQLPSFEEKDTLQEIIKELTSWLKSIQLGGK